MALRAAMLLPLLTGLAVAGCGGRAHDDERQALSDPVLTAALGEQLMVDPDLARMNPRHAVLTDPGPASAPIPPEDTSPETVAAARAEAARQAGGALLRAPEPVPAGPSGAGLTAQLTANGALAESGGGRDCAHRLSYAFAWAARMPPVLPVYPRGHVQEAAGSDDAGCRLRVVNFLTPVAVSDVIDFYWSRGTRAGLAPQHRMQGDDHVVSGRKGAAAFVVYVRARDLLTEADLVTTGL